MKRAAATVVLAGLSLSCAAAQSGGPADIKPGEAFSLRAGEKASVGGLVVTFLSVTEDSRCPKGEQCITAGRARLSLEAAPPGGSPVRIELDSARQTETEVGGYFLTLLGLEPYPISGRPIAPADYVAKLSVGRSGPAPQPKK